MGENQVHFLRGFGGEIFLLSRVMLPHLFVLVKIRIFLYIHLILRIHLEKMCFSSSPFIYSRDVLGLIQIMKFGVIFSFQRLVSFIGLCISLALAIPGSLDPSCTICFISFEFGFHLHILSLRLLFMLLCYMLY